MKTLYFGTRPLFAPDMEGAGGGAAETNPTTEGASGASEGEEVSHEAGEHEDDGEAEGDDTGSLAEDDAEDFEHDGQKYRLPKALKPLLMMQQDYTQKTQAVAETRKALEQQQQQFAQQAEAEKASIREVAQLVNLDARLEQFKGVNWQALQQQDPLQAQSLWMEFQQTKDARADLAGQLSQKAAERSREAERQRATRLEEAGKTLAREIKGWGPQLAQELTSYASSVGLSENEIREMNLHPTYVKLLHQAYVGQQLMNKQLAAAKSPAPAQAKPVPTVGGNARAAKDPNKMSMSEYAKWRAAGNG